MLHDTNNGKTWYYCERCGKPTDWTVHSCTPKEILDNL